MGHCPFVEHRFSSSDGQTRIRRNRSSRAGRSASAALVEVCSVRTLNRTTENKGQGVRVALVRSRSSAIPGPRSSCKAAGRPEAARRSDKAGPCTDCPEPIVNFSSLAVARTASDHQSSTRSSLVKSKIALQHTVDPPELHSSCSIREEVANTSSLTMRSRWSAT